MIAVLDFGSQTAHLITRRIKQKGGKAELISPASALSFIKKHKPTGIILSGGPSSVYEKNAPTVDPKIFSLDIPILSICYGMQLAMKLLGGKVTAGHREYGPAQLKIKNFKLKITNDLSESFVVWMNHGDEVVSLPEGFVDIGSTQNVKHAFVANTAKKNYATLFHPEVEHTEGGEVIFGNFMDICGEEVKHHAIDIDEILKKIRSEVGEEGCVIGAVSGGVDSTVAGVLAAKALGKRFIPIFVDNGLMREGTEESVKRIFTEFSNIRPVVLKVEEEMLQKLKGIRDPERKRRVIGAFYIELFEREMDKTISSGLAVTHLLQGTIYSDVIESKGSKFASKIKSHHNVAGLPKNMRLRLLEPLRHFYKDEVREIGAKLGLPKEFIYKQPFPGPGYAVRIRGEVTQDRLKKIRKADNIVMEVLQKANYVDKVFQSYPVLTGAFSTGIKGDAKFFGEVIALRVVNTKDIMTATPVPLPYNILGILASRIVNEVPEISRVVYDITTKPPATMEWE